MDLKDTSTSHKLSSIQVLIGTVVSTKMAKTVVVEIRSRKRHAKYHKSYTVTKRLKAHTEEVYELGDRVEIVAVRPISKDKRFKVVRKT